MNQMKGKIVLITGCDNGIGRQAAYELAGSGATILMHVQNFSAGELVLQHLRKLLPDASLDLFVADFENRHDIEKMATDIHAVYAKLDVLINNDSVYVEEHSLTTDLIEKTFAVNHIAPFLLTRLLLPLLKCSVDPRIINVSSHAHYAAQFNIKKLQQEQLYDGAKAYSRSKLCNLLFTYALAEKLEDQKIKVNAVHPGSIVVSPSVNLFGQTGGQTDEDGADTIVFLASSDEVAEVSGSYFMSRAPIQSSYASYSSRYQRQLWKFSEQITMSGDYAIATKPEKIVVNKTKRANIFQNFRSKTSKIKSWFFGQTASEHFNVRKNAEYGRR